MCIRDSYDRLEWYLADPGDFSCQKKISAPIETCLQIIFCLQIHFFDLNSFVISNFVYFDKQAWYLTTSGGRCSKEKFLLWYFTYWRRHFLTLLLYYFITLSLYHFITLSLYYFITLLLCLLVCLLSAGPLLAYLFHFEVPGGVSSVKVKR